MSCRRIPLLLAVLAPIACSPSAGSAGEAGNGVKIYPAFPVFESEGSRRVARERLECNPCTEIMDRGEEGKGSRYMINAQAGVRFTREHIRATRVDAIGGAYVVSIVLTEPAQRQINSMVDSPLAEAASFVGPDLVGIVPLRLWGDRYHLAVLNSADEAESVRRAIVGRE